MAKLKLILALLLSLSLTAQVYATGERVVVAEGETKTITDGEFSDLTDAINGSAIYNDGKVEIENSKFTDNKASIYAGAIYNNGELVIADGTEALSTEFSNNTAHAGGAISSLDGSSLEIGDYTTFDSNKTFDEGGDAGGAIYISEADLKIGDNVSFTNNTALSLQDENSGSKGVAGAVYVYNSDVEIGDNVEFEDNKSKYAGGALYIWNGDGISESTIGDNAVFTNNESLLAYGGAIGNFDGELTIGEDAEFTGNKAATNGGAIYSGNFYTTDAELNIEEGASFSGNEASNGGAIYSDGEATITGAEFTGNKASNGNGGAIYNSGDTEIENSEFTSNTAISGNGGAIYVKKTGKATVLNSIFNDNKVDGEGDPDFGYGGAIHVSGEASIIGSDFSRNVADTAGALSGGTSSNLEIKVSSFTKNTAKGAGAVGIYKKGLVENVIFTSNTATATEQYSPSEQVGAGALFAGSVSNVVIKDSEFNYNESAANGGAIGTRFAVMPNGSKTNNSGAKLDIVDTTFEGNKAATDGGAIYNTFYNNEANEGYVTISGSEFTNNEAKAGGAIYNDGTKDLAGNGGAIKVTDSKFTGNKAGENGGAVYNSGEMIIVDTSFVNNSATGNGGAIYSDSDLTINAETKDILFSGNSATKGSDIYVNKEDAVINLNVANGKTIEFDGVTSGNKYQIIIATMPTSVVSNSPALANAPVATQVSENVVYNSIIENAQITVKNGASLHLAEGSELKGSSTVSMETGSALNTIDGKTTNFNNITVADGVSIKLDVDLSNGGSADKYVIANGANITVDDISYIGGNSATSSAIDFNLADFLGISKSQLTVTATAQTETTILSPIRYLKGSVSSTGDVVFNPTGNSYKDFNQTALVASVAQIGGYMMQLNAYDNAFKEMDTKLSTFNKVETLAKKSNGVDTNMSSIWVRPYSTFEDIELNNGPKFSNKSYGAYFGTDSKVQDLGKDFSGVLSMYAGYNNSHQDFDGGNVYQDAGIVGVTAMTYKDNFFAGLTLNTGANLSKIETTYGTDNMTMFMAGVGAKAGYNFEFESGKYILQPSVMLAYSMINAGDYISCAGYKMSSEMFNAVNIEPAVKFMCNFDNGWKPYVGVSAMFTSMGKTKFKAASDVLPEFNTKDYFKGFIGTSKTISDRCAAYLQGSALCQGRSGFDVQAGFSIAFGNNKVAEVKKEEPAPTVATPAKEVKPSTTKTSVKAPEIIKKQATTTQKPAAKK